LTSLCSRPTIKISMKPNNLEPRLRGAAVRSLAQVAVLAAILSLLGAATVGAQQDDHKRKVPIVDKITSTNGQEAFSGSIQAVDFKTSLLQVHSTADNTDEYFPLKKTVHVATADGGRVTVDRLKPGISVLVYYEQKGDHRAVKEIVVLGNAAEAPKAKPAPPS
jgi:hypothetical protein